MARKVKDLPLHFQKGKLEFDKLIRIFWSNKLDSNGRPDETPENIALLYILMVENVKYMENHLTAIGDRVLAKMEQVGKDKILLPEYGQKLFFDKEAQWLYAEPITDVEWKEYDEQCNKDFLKK
jgi:hypothetical protein